MLAKINYDDRQHAGYQEGRRLGPEALALWLAAFAEHAPRTRPLAVLDLGSGTGRFAPALAEAFGGPVCGVEPSARMRALAEAAPHPPAVSYREGCAERIPLPDASCDLVLMFLSFHHVEDRGRGAAEIARVLRPGGRVFIRSTFADRMPALEWHRYFPRARAIEERMFPSSAEVVRVFAAAGLACLALVPVAVPSVPTLAELAARLRTRSISTFEHLTEREIEEGFARLAAAVAADPARPPAEDPGDLLVLG